MRVYRQLRPGGLVAFTAQSLVAGDGADLPRFALGRDLRFGHSPDYVAATLSSEGFDIMLLEPASTRRERSIPVAGLVVVASKP